MNPRLAAGSAAVVFLLSLGGTVESRQSAPPQQAQPMFRGSTTVIEVDVIVRDKARKFVGDLRASDFEVFEDGVPQDVSVVYRVVGPGEALPPGASEGGALPAPPPQQIQRVLVLFFDQAHIQPGGFDRAKKAALAFVTNDFRQGDVGGVVSGGTMVNNRLTGSRGELEAAVQSLTPAPEMSAVGRELRQWPRFVDLYEAWRVVRMEPANMANARTMLDFVVQRACGEQPDSCRGAGGASMVEAEVQNKATQLVAQARVLGKQTLDTMNGLANGMARLPGRKTIIMMTDGFWVEDSMGSLRDVVSRASRASVRIYALDTRGLNRGTASSDIISAANPQQPQLAGPSMGDVSADGPNSLAVDTGGYVIRNENDFGKAFTEIDRDTSSYYVVGFRTSKQLDGKFHEVDVKVKRSGVTVRARKGYLALPELAQAQPAATPGEGAPAAPSTAAREAAPAATPPVAGAAVETPAATLNAPAPELAGALRLRPDMSEQVASLEPKAAKAGASAAYPANLMKQARDGWAAYQRGAVGDAQKSLEPAAAHAAAPPWVVYVLGWSQYAQAQAVAAAVSWERVRAAVPEFSAVYFDLTDAYLRQREFGKAVDVLRAAEKRWPKDVEVYNALGVVQLSRGALDDAITTFESGVGVGPADATAAYNLARSLELRFVRASRQRRGGAGSVQLGPMLQDRDRAVEYYKRVVALGGPFVEQSKEGLTRLGVK